MHLVESNRHPAGQQLDSYYSTKILEMCLCKWIMKLNPVLKGLSGLLKINCQFATLAKITPPSTHTHPPLMLRLRRFFDDITLTLYTWLRTLQRHLFAVLL